MQSLEGKSDNFQIKISKISFISDNDLQPRLLSSFITTEFYQPFIFRGKKTTISCMVPNLFCSDFNLAKNE